MSTETKLISIITIVYNDVDSVGKTIDSVLHNKNEFVEYLVIDGGSTDGTVQVIEKFGTGVDVFVSEKDRGISDAFNKGILRASGKWLLFLNSGDIFRNGININEISTTLERNQDQLICYYNVLLSNGAHTMPTAAMISKGNDAIVTQAEIPHQGAFIQKACFDQYGFFNTFFSLRMDYEFFARVRKEKHRIMHINEVLVTYEAEGRSNQRSNFEIFLREGIMVKLKYHMALNVGEVARFSYFIFKRMFK